MPSTQRRMSSRNAPADHVRGRPWKPAVQRTAPTTRTPSAICPWPPQHSALQRDKVTHGGTEKNGPHSRGCAATGPFSQVVASVVAGVVSSFRTCRTGVSRHRGQLRRASRGCEGAGWTLPGCRRPGLSLLPSLSKSARSRRRPGLTGSPGPGSTPWLTANRPRARRRSSRGPGGRRPPRPRSLPAPWS